MENSGMNFGGDGLWALLLFAIIFGGGFGFGGNRGDVATQGFVANEFTQRDINNGFQNTNNLLNGLSTSILENRYSNQLAEGQTQRDILTQTNELNTNLLTTALQNQSKMDECCCSLRAQSIENTQKILDAMSQNTIDNLRSEVNDLKNTITANGIGTGIINAVRPYPTPSYLVSSPYQSLYNGFYGSNWYGNTIV